MATLGFALFGACSDSDNEPVDPGPAASCSTLNDCTWGEIDHEIHSKVDCPCLYGCGFLPLSKETVARRKQQYDALCDPMKNGKGDACGIDDCIVPPELACVAGTCAIPSDGSS